MTMPQSGTGVDQVIAELEARRARDVRWDLGRTFGLVYDGGPSVHEVAERAARLFLHENALNTKAFPSLAAIQADVVGWTGSLLNAPPEAAGFMTSGGTDSILCAVLAARERGAKERGITAPEMVLAESAHAAFHKAAHMFGVKAVKTRVRPDWTADPDAMRAAVTPNTVLVVGSAPHYPQGVVDDIPAIAALAAGACASCHVDACMGGFVLPFAERLGRPVPPWDFRVPGVTSISADVHKLGYAPKGASVVLYRTKALRAYQTFLFDDWLGGFYGSPGLQGTRSGLPMAAACGHHAATAGPGCSRMERSPSCPGRRPAGCPKTRPARETTPCRLHPTPPVLRQELTTAIAAPLSLAGVDALRLPAAPQARRRDGREARALRPRASPAAAPRSPRPPPFTV
jgi:glutamate/tyrosine decarboxylase-like PLP-dependent enzyme